MASTDKAASSKANAANKPKMSQEQIISGFNELRQQQRAVASKISELEMEKKEHDLVIETLVEVDESRKCYRMVGGVLVERTVKEVLPALRTNSEQLGKVIENLTKQLETRGKELQEYRERHNIKVRGEQGDSQQDQKKTSSTQGVLVARDSIQDVE